jgi:hypothetical protein
MIYALSIGPMRNKDADIKAILWKYKYAKPTDQ